MHKRRVPWDFLSRPAREYPRTQNEGAFVVSYQACIRACVTIDVLKVVLLRCAFTLCFYVVL